MLSYLQPLLFCLFVAIAPDLFLIACVYLCRNIFEVLKNVLPLYPRMKTNFSFCVLTNQETVCAAL